MRACDVDPNSKSDSPLDQLSRPLAFYKSDVGTRIELYPKVEGGEEVTKVKVEVKIRQASRANRHTICHAMAVPIVTTVAVAVVKRRCSSSIHDVRGTAASVTLDHHPSEPNFALVRFVIITVAITAIPSIQV